MKKWTSEFPQDLQDKIERVEAKISTQLAERAEYATLNQQKVLNAFRDHNVNEFSFYGSTGYGYDDMGRDTIEAIYATTFGAEKAIVRPQLTSGTHAISTALFGVMRPGDDLLYITGKPYDTLLSVVGYEGNGIATFKEYDMGFDFVPLQEDFSVDFEAVKQQITEKTKVVAIQRSRGYDNRPSFTIAKIEEMVRKVREINPDLIIFVDNCYGEFIEDLEPTDVGCDLMAGSLIKNPGGGLVSSGGYICGREDLVDLCGYRLTAPGIGLEGGATGSALRPMFQGFFLAPHVSNEAVKGAIFTAALMNEFNISSTPGWNDKRTDLIQLISMPDAESMIKFCQQIQRFSPVDSKVLPEPAYMPGYTDDVIMAAGTFIQGSSIELSSDGPIRPPYNLYVQGGLTYEHVKIAVASACAEIFY